MNRRKFESILQAFKRKDGSPADQEWQSAEDSKTAIDEAPRKWDSAKVAGDESKRDDSSTGNQTKGDDPLVANRIDVGANKRNCDDDVSEGEPIGAIGEEGIERVRIAECVVDTFDPREQSG